MNNNDDDFESIVPFLPPTLPINQTHSDYIIKVVTTLRDCLFVPRYYGIWNILNEERNFVPHRTLFETFLEHFTNSYNCANSDLLQIRLATGTVVTELLFRNIRKPLENLYLEFICHVHTLARNTPSYSENLFRLLFEFSEIFHRIPDFNPRDSRNLFQREVNSIKYFIDTLDDYFRQNPANTLPFQPGELLNIISWFIHVHCGYAIELIQTRTFDNNLSFRPHLFDIASVFAYIWDRNYISPYQQARNVSCITLTDCTDTLFYSFIISPNRFRVISERERLANPNLTTRNNRNSFQSTTLSPNASISPPNNHPRSSSLDSSNNTRRNANTLTSNSHSTRNQIPI